MSDSNVLVRSSSGLKFVTVFFVICCQSDQMALFSEEQTEALKALFKDSVEAVEAAVKPILDREAGECVRTSFCYYEGATTPLRLACRWLLSR